MAEMIVEQAESDAFECIGDGRDLGEDIDAVPVLVDHAVDAADPDLRVVEDGCGTEPYR